MDNIWQRDIYSIHILWNYNLLKTFNKGFISHSDHTYTTWITYLNSLFQTISLHPQLLYKIHLDYTVSKRSKWKVNKVTVFWDVTLCNLVDCYQSSDETSCLHLESLSVNHVQTKWKAIYGEEGPGTLSKPGPRSCAPHSHPQRNFQLSGYLSYPRRQ
jgi:hypothetical protein